MGVGGEGGGGGMGVGRTGPSNLREVIVLKQMSLIIIIMTASEATAVVVL